MDDAVKSIESEFNTCIGIVNVLSMSVSSSFIRTHAYKEIKGMVPDSVYNYIVDNRLYNNNNVNIAWSVSRIIEDLNNTLSQHRFVHSLNVAKTAKALAEIYNVNPNTAYLAGILHDCAKHLNNEQLIEMCKNNNIFISKTEELCPHLLHAKVGAFIAKNKYGITDTEVLEAITWHTTGKPNMTVLEQIIFSADYIEPGRDKQPNLDELRQIAQSDLDLLVFRILKDTIEYLTAKQLKTIDKHTMDAYEYYKQLIEER